MIVRSTAEVVRLTLTVPAEAERAFSVFAAGIDSWWPHEATWSRDVLETIGIEPMEGGLCFERGPHGFECDWGRVLAWEPPRRLVLAWQVGPGRVPEPDPERASELEVRFVTAEAGVTRVELEHRAFERHGEGAAAYREAMGSPEGWPRILARYAAMFETR